MNLQEIEKVFQEVLLTLGETNDIHHPVKSAYDYFKDGDYVATWKILEAFFVPIRLLEFTQHAVNKIGTESDKRMIKELLRVRNLLAPLHPGLHRLFHVK